MRLKALSPSNWATTAQKALMIAVFVLLGCARFESPPTLWIERAKRRGWRDPYHSHKNTLANSIVLDTHIESAFGRTAGPRAASVR